MNHTVTADWPFGNFAPLRRPTTRNPLLLWMDRQWQRGVLAKLDHRMLDDIGVLRSAAHREARRWD
jgi:uncharacterized protein YjiS (DUF1127 family)